MYVGTACAIISIRISFSALDNNFSFHLDNLLFNRSSNLWKVLCLFFPTKDVSPRYFSCYFIISAPNLILTSSWIAWGVFRLKKSEVFSRFSWCPGACSYFSKIVIKVEHSSFIAPQKIRMSLAKNKCETLGFRLIYFVSVPS